MIHPFRAPGCGFDPASEWYTGEPCVARDGWTIWLGRSRRYYCPEHGPSHPSRMRNITDRDVLR